MAEIFEKWSVANHRIVFGMRQIKFLIGLMHWTQDNHHCSCIPSLDGIANGGKLKEILKVSLERAALCKIDADQVDTISKAANPGKFKDERKWADWEPQMVNYLSTIPGVTGIPLSYVVRENQEPDHETDFGEDFTSEMVARASLSGPVFQADVQKVHQLIKNFLVAEMAEQWIQDYEQQANGCHDMQALRHHYKGEGNTSRRIATAEQLCTTLHYKNERALAFSKFLDKMQRMFNIY